MFFFVKQKTAYEMRISDWSSDVCSSDLVLHKRVALLRVSTEDTPRVPLSEQLKVETLPNGFAKIEIRHGFMQPVDVPETLERCRTFGQIGRASCRERVCQSVSISVVAVSLKKKNKSSNIDIINLN